MMGRAHWSRLRWVLEMGYRLLLCLGIGDEVMLQGRLVSYQHKLETRNCAE